MDSLSLPAAGSQHPRVRYVRQIAGRLGQSRPGLFVAEGLWAHELVAGLDASVDTFLWCPESARSPMAHTVAARVARKAATALRISAKTLQRLCDRDHSDGMVSVVALPDWRHHDLRLGDEALVLVADGIEIPGNLGALIRTVDACGADCLIITNRRTRLAHPHVFRGSRGMNLRVPSLEFASPGEASEWLHRKGFITFLATVANSATPFREVRFPRRTAIVVGNERKGIGNGWTDLRLPEITIPMHGRADSLNVAVSAAILLYAANATMAAPSSMRSEESGA